MKKVVIVVLNYLNYNDTIECIDSIKKDKYENKELIIVDNNSHNDSWRVLNDKYRGEKNIHLIRTERNLGFANGNNIGIDYARDKLKSNFILLVNNDTIFKDEEMIIKLMEAYEDGIAVIGPRIIAANSIDQNPVNTSVSKKKIQWERKYLNSYKYKLKQSYIYKKMRSNIILQRINKKIKNKNIVVTPNTQEGIELVLHGACMLLTESYFKYYPRLFPETFLYYEENILTLLTRKQNLKKKFIDYTYIYHKEDQSSEMSFNNSDDVRLKYLFDSMNICEKIIDMSYDDIINIYFKKL